MTAVREYFRSIKKPFYLKKKFLIASVIILLGSLIAGSLLTWRNYNLVKDLDKPVNWKKVADPMALPGIVVMLYLVGVAMWLAIVVAGFKKAVLNSASDITDMPRVSLQDGEEKMGEAEFTHRRSPGTLETPGRLTITNQRIVHTPKYSAKRIRTLVGMDEPDVAFYLPLAEVRQCGFGLDPKDAYRFGVITMDGTLHSFYSAHSPLVKAMDNLGWKKMQAGEMVYWIR